VLYPASPGRATPESGQQDLKEKAGQARDIGPLAGQVFVKMSASGWQTAPPQAIDLEVVMVTKSACPQQLLESSLGGIHLERPASLIYEVWQRAEWFTPLHDHSVRRVFESVPLPSLSASAEKLT